MAEELIYEAEVGPEKPDPLGLRKRLSQPKPDPFGLRARLMPTTTPEPPKPKFNLTLTDLGKPQVQSQPYIDPANAVAPKEQTIVPGRDNTGIAQPVIGNPIMVNGSPQLESERIANEVAAAEDRVHKELQNPDKAIKDILHKKFLKSQAGVYGTMNQYAADEAQRIRMDYLLKSINKDNSDVEEYKKDLGENAEKAREVIAQVGTPQAQSDLYLLDHQDEINSEKGTKIAKNAKKIAEDKLKYDIKTGRLIRPIGTVDALLYGAETRANEIDLFDKYMGMDDGADEFMKAEFDKRRTTHDPHEPLPVAEGALPHISEMLGSNAIPMIKGGVVSAGASVLGFPEAAPWLAAAVNTPEYAGRAFVTSWESNYNQLVSQGVPEKEALATAKKQAQFDAAAAAVQGGLQTFAGVKLAGSAGSGFRWTPGFKNAMKGLVSEGKHFGKEILKSGVPNAGLAGALEMSKNITAQGKGIERENWENVIPAMGSQILFEVALGGVAKGFKGISKITEANKNIIKANIAKVPDEIITQKLGEMVADGTITPQEADHVVNNELPTIRNEEMKIPETVTDDNTRQKIKEKIAEHEEISLKLKGGENGEGKVADALSGPLKERKKQIEEDVEILSKDPKEQERLLTLKAKELERELSEDVDARKDGGKPKLEDRKPTERRLKEINGMLKEVTDKVNSNEYRAGELVNKHLDKIAPSHQQFAKENPEQYLKDIADQAQSANEGFDAEGNKIVLGTHQEEMIKMGFPKEIVETAVEMYPKEKPRHTVSTPVIRNVKLKEGVVDPNAEVVTEPIINFENAKEGDVVIHAGKKVTVVGKTKSRGGNDVIEVKEAPKTKEEIKEQALQNVFNRVAGQYKKLKPTWEDIERNHPSEVRKEVDELTALENSKTATYTIDADQWAKDVQSEHSITEPVKEATEPPPAEQVGEPLRLNHATTETIYKEGGIPERMETPTKTGDVLEAQARKSIEDGYDFDKKAKEVMEENGQFEDVDQRVFDIRVAELKDQQKGMDITSPEFDKIQSEIEKLSRASDVAGTIGGRFLQSRRGNAPVEETISDFVSREKEAAGVSRLTEDQKRTVEKEFKELEDAKLKFEEEKAKWAADVALKEQVKGAKKTNKTTEDFKKDRADIIARMKEKWEKQKNLGIIKRPEDDFIIQMAPEILKLVKSYVEEGASKLGDIVNRAYEEVKGFADGIAPEDIRDIIAGKYTEQKEKTVNDARARLKDIIDEAKLIDQLEILKKGEIPKNERAKIKRNREITQLQDKIKEHKRLIELEEELDRLRERKEKAHKDKTERPISDKEQDLLDKIEKERKDWKEELTKSPEERALLAKKTRLNKEAEQIEKDIAEGKYEKPEKKAPIPMDEATLKAYDRLIKLKAEREARLIKEQNAAMTGWQKAGKAIVEVLNTPRAIMSSFDLSAPGRQALVASISHPILAKRAFGEMLRAAKSEKVFNRYFHELRESPDYKTMQDSKLGINDPLDPRLSAKEEAFMSNLAQKIPGAGRIVKGSERAYVLYLNKMRVDIFRQGIDAFMSAGKTPENSPELYKALAAHINNTTGRGNVGGKLENAVPALNTLFFSPRLMASRINLLTNFANPSFYKNVPKEVRAMYFKDMAKFIGAGTALLGLSALAGADVEKDPRSSDFLKVKVGDTRYDILGGFAAYMRTVAQIVSGQKKNLKSGDIKELDGKKAFGEDRGDVGLRFFRGKLAPIVGTGYDLISGRDILGNEILPQFGGAGKKQKDLTDIGLDLATPLISNDIIRAIKDPSVKNLLSIPASGLGIGVQDFGDDVKGSGGGSSSSGSYRNERSSNRNERSNSRN